MKRLWMKLTIFTALMAVAFGISLLSCNVGTRIDGTFTPADGATGVALDAAVQVVFTGVIPDSVDWTSAFTLTAEGSTANACTSITYDSATLTATCSHNDFDPDTVYTGTVTGVIGYTPTSTFTTIGGSLTVTAVSKTSVTATTDGEGAIAITYTFDAAPTTGPTLAVTGTGSPVAGTCAVDPADATKYTCPVTGLAGCATFTDYTATLSSPELSADYVSTFNSADDEFTSSATLPVEGTYPDCNNDDPPVPVTCGGCWCECDRLKDTGSVETTVANGVLTATLSNEGASVGAYFYKNHSNDLAVAIEIQAFSADPMGITAGMLQSTMEEVAEQVLVNLGLFTSEEYSGPVLMRSDGEGGGCYGTASAALSVTRFCEVVKGGTATIYAAIDGSWTRLDGSKMTSSYGDCGDYSYSLAQIFTGLSFSMMDDGGGTSEAQFAWIRFNASPVSGDASDCPDF